MKSEPQGLIFPTVRNAWKESSLSLSATNHTNNPPRFSFLLTVFLLILAATSAQGQTVTARVAAGDMPFAVAVNPVTNKIYVANYASANVTVIEGATDSTTTATVGTGPIALAVNPVTNKIYVANQGSPPNFANGSVTVIDGATNTTTTVAPGTAPFAVAVNP